MKCLVAGLVILSPSMASAFDVEIEADAMISQNRPNMQGVIDPGLALLRARGWRCDSVSAVRPYLASDGYTIICNGFNYTYNFSHADGNWSVEVAK